MGPQRESPLTESESDGGGRKQGNTETHKVPFSVLLAAPGASKAGNCLGFPGRLIRAAWESRSAAAAGFIAHYGGMYPDGCEQTADRLDACIS